MAGAVPPAEPEPTNAGIDNRRETCLNIIDDQFNGVEKMRLLLKLRVLKDQAYDLKYHHKLQGFIYSLLDETPYVKLHDRRGYKFFCFSNILPSVDATTGTTRSLIISSPDVGLI
ncbi:MAG TPA: hypothetical protein EYP46_03510, partial [Hadesarchaea archaeon]|nr:hypothetical protein [Hadesarchaea archaeon]